MNKLGWDLPPGCSVNDIPGNRLEDADFENAENAVLNALYESGGHISSYYLIAELIKPIIEIYQQKTLEIRKEINNDHNYYLGWLKDEIWSWVNECLMNTKRKGDYEVEITAYKRVLKLLGEKID